MIKKIRRFLSRVYDLPNAFRVLDVMDEAGCRIKPMNDDKTYWQIESPWYVSQKSAEDLRRIVGSKRQYKERNPLWHRVFFPNFRENARVLYFWV